MTTPMQSGEDRSPKRQARLVEELQNECGKLLGRPPQEIAPDVSFLALGADSLLLLRLSQTVKDRFGIKAPFRRLLDDLGAVQMLATYLDQSLPPESAQLDPRKPEAKPLAAGALANAIAEAPAQPSRMQNIFAQQLKVITMQLELIRSQAPAAELSGNASTDAKPPIRRSDPRQWIYAPSWARSSVIPKEYSLGGSWLLFADAIGLGHELARQLRSEGSRVLVVQSGKEYLRLSSTEWSIDPRNRKHYSDLLHDIGGEAPSRILHLWNFGPPQAVEEVVEMFGRYQSLVFLAQALNEVGGRMQLAVVSNRTHDVLGAGRIQPGKALLLGPCMAIQREFSTLSCRSIDFDTDGQNQQEVQTLIRQLRLELESSPLEESVAYAAGQRWIPCFEQVRVPETAKTPFRKNSVYLITGGLGGIGMCMAEYLASTYGAKLVLTGRTARNDAPGLEPLRALGAEFLVFAADVSSKAEMAAVVSKAKQRFGSIQGVIHAAGIPGGGFITFQSAEDLAALRPKVLGTTVLHQIFQDEPLDLMVLCSSLVSALGPPGRAEYAAANAFLDAYASQAKGSRRYKTIAINWDAWRDVGMGAPQRLPVELQQFTNGKPVGAMTTAEALDAFEMALGTGLSRVLVSTRDLPAIHREYKREYKQAGIDLADSVLTHDNVDAEGPISDGSMFEKILSEVQALTPEQVQAAINNELEIQ